MPWALAIAAEEPAIGISRRVQPGTSGNARPRSPENRRGLAGANSDKSTRASKPASMSPPKTRRALRISENTRRDTDHGDVGGHMGHHDRASADD